MALTLTSIEAAPATVLLPSAASLGIIDSPNEDLGKLAKLDQHSLALARAMEPTDAISKALAPPPKAFSFGYMAYMPDPQYGGLMPWPGLAPESLQKVVRTNLAPEMIIATRVADVLRYSHKSSHPWKPGWRIELRESAKTPSTWDKRDIKLCETMVENCNIELDEYQARKRDASYYQSFRSFLATLTRDFLTYDAMALWTDLDPRGRVKGWSCLPAGNIRLADPTIGYLGNKEHFAVLVDQTGKVVHAFTREQLTWFVGNPRVDPDIGGYPWSRLDVGIRIVDAFQAAFDMNADRFSKSGIPTGMMLLKGAGFTQNEVDAIARQFQNLKKGVSKIWALPAMVVPKDSEIEFLDLTAIAGEDAQYVMHMNLTIGVFCLLYQYPYKRLGFHISGTEKDTESLLDGDGQEAPTDEEDVGLLTLLGNIEHVLNEYLIWTRFPHLQLVFSGKAPREDAREYEARQLAMTWSERRAQVDLPPLTELVEKMMEEAEAEAKAAKDTDGGLESKEKPNESPKPKKPSGKARINVKIKEGQRATATAPGDSDSKGDEADLDEAEPTEEELEAAEAEADAEAVEEERKELMKIARILSLIPNDPGMTAAMQSLTTKLYGGGDAGMGGNPFEEGNPNAGGGGGGGNPMFPASRDPAKAEAHGATSGVRRHSPRRGLKTKLNPGKR